MLKAVFAYAVLRGLLDALTKRPDLHKRLLMVRLTKVMRAAAVAFGPFNDSLSELARDFHGFALALREYERWVGQYEKDGET